MKPPADTESRRLCSLLCLALGLILAAALIASSATAAPAKSREGESHGKSKEGQSHGKGGDHGKGGNDEGHGKGRKVEIQAGCAGDTLSGSVRTKAAGALTLTLLAKRTAHARFASTGRSVSLAASKSGSYPFSFDVATLKAVAFRVDSGETHGNVVPAASCGPGHQVPEAPFSLLLPLSVLGFVGLTVARRRRKSVRFGR